MAVRLAELAVVWEPNQANIWNTLGVAYHRAVNWPAATEALRKSMALNNQPRPEDVVLGRLPRGGRLREVAPVGGVELKRSGPSPRLRRRLLY